MTEHLADIENAEAPDFEKILQHLRAASLDGVRCDLAELRGVIGNQCVSPRNQLQCQLALADTAVASDQHAHPMYVHHHAVNDDLAGQKLCQSIT